MHAPILLGRTKFCQPGYGTACGRCRDQDERFNRARAQEQEARGTGRHRAFGGMPPRPVEVTARRRRGHEPGQDAPAISAGLDAPLPPLPLLLSVFSFCTCTGPWLGSNHEKKCDDDMPVLRSLRCALRA
jgi:hypothetical protein